MRNYGFGRAVKVLAMVLAASLLFGVVTMQLWNWLMPAILGLHTITFWQALGLFLLSKLLFGGFHRHGSRGRGWGRHGRGRWAQMSPEERMHFREGMRGRRNCWPPQARANAAEAEVR